MTMKRRNFFASLLAGTVGAVLPVWHRGAEAINMRYPQLYDGSDITSWPDIFKRMTMANLGVTEVGGQINIDPQYHSLLGYNPNRSWGPNTPVSEVLMLGDLSRVFGLERFTLDQVSRLVVNQLGQVVPIDLANFKLGDLGFAPFQSVEHLAQQIQGLADTALGEVKPIMDLFAKYQGLGGALFGGDLQGSIREILNLYPDFGKEVLGALDLSKYGIVGAGSIPGLIQNPIGTFMNWGQSRISEIPGLKDVPWAQYPLKLLLSGRFAMIDVVLGVKEALNTNFANTVTGSSEQGFNLQCGNRSCPHVELAGAGFLGQRFITQAQEALGGKNLLKYVNGGKEPTGWKPFGEYGPKVAIFDVDERTDTVRFGLFFCIRFWLFGVEHKTPEFIGVPFFKASVKNWIPAP